MHHVHLDGAATFLRLPVLAKALERVPRSDELHVHIEQLSYVDHAALEVILNWERQAERAGGRLVLEWEELRGMSLGVRPRAAVATRQAASLVAV